MALPLMSPSDLERWNEERFSVQRTLTQRFPSFEPEHEVWHYFDDSDIRFRESDYRDRQHRLMSEYVQRLRKCTRRY